MTDAAPLEILVNIDVPDIGRAVAFYEGGLGLRFRRRLFGGSVAELSGPGLRLFLLERRAGSIAAPGTGLRRDFGRHWTPVHLDLSVADLAAAVARAVGHGARQEGAIGRHRWGEIATMADPFGNGFCLIAFTPAGYDGEV